MGDAEAEQRLEQGQVDDLTGAGKSIAAVGVPAVDGHHAGHCAEDAGDLIGKGHGRQVGWSVGKSGHADVTAHTLGDGAEARSVFVGAGLTES